MGGRPILYATDFAWQAADMTRLGGRYGPDVTFLGIAHRRRDGTWGDITATLLEGRT